MEDPDLVLWSAGAEGPAGWSTSAAPGSECRLGTDGAALRLDYSLAGPGAWVIARRTLAATLPAHWIVALTVRGEASPNELQLKLVDSTGANVWWWRRPDVTLAREAARLVFRRAGLAFAWGPAGGGDPARLGAVELAIAAGRGGSGTLWIDDLRVEARPATAGPPVPSAVQASSHAPGHAPDVTLDNDQRTAWRPAAGDGHPWITLDLGQAREWGGLLVDFAGAAPASRVLGSGDGVAWTALADDPGGAGGRRWLRTGEAESRFVRLELPPASAAAITRLAVVPIELAVSPARWAAGVAATCPRGHFPRHLVGEQAAWAVVGGDGDERKGLLGEDGALEVGLEGFTLEPFLWLGDRLVTWADVESHGTLADRDLPVPSIEWVATDLRLRITAFVTGAAGRSALVVRYAFTRAGDVTQDARLFVAIRPFQVTPAWQSLNLTGAIAPLTRLAHDGVRVRVNGTRDVVAVTRPDGFGSARSAEALHALGAGRLPPGEAVEDPLGFAEGVLAFDLRGPAASVVVAVPLFADTPPLPSGLEAPAADAWGTARLDDAVAGWRTRLAGVPVALPPSAAPFAESLRASLAWILVDREGPRIQPGPRAYRRSWIRDGAMTATALAEMGFAEEARAFFRWYAPHQLPDGRVPCAVDGRGVDSTVEHDSHGELAWGVVEVFRLTKDIGFLRELWPHVRRAAEAIATLRAQRTGDAFRGTACFGLLPESISHEGYAGNPVHAYWDDFFALCGLTAAAEAAAVLGEPETAVRLGAERDALRADVHASIARTRAQHGIDFLPGSAELGDFDPTSSAIALDPAGEGARLPRAALERTFARYWEEFDARRRGAGTAYTPYEVRNATALLWLGWKARALALLGWLIDDQRPPAWRQWPEVAHRDPRAPRFLGDLPHGWVASSFVRAFRRLIASEEEDGTLVLAAGVPEPWVREAPGLRVRGLPTRFGPLDLTMAAAAADVVRVTLGGVRPPAGIVLVSPCAAPLREVVVDGRVRAGDERQRVRLAEPAAVVELRY